MPPSPAVGVFPRREMRVENHKRGRSLESGIHYRDDDDLALFNELRSRERENFLLQSNDDFDDIFSTKCRYFPDYTLGISIPVRGESSDLLNTGGDKNDYDWLITPPETPLFVSLDDDLPPTNLPRGRSRSQPVPVPLSSSTEKGYRNSRGSASPQRLSQSPRSSNNSLQYRSRPLSAIHSSPPPTLRQPSASRRLSPPPSKPKPAMLSSMPTRRRMSTGSVSAVIPSGVRGASPIKTSRGNSASPKKCSWQSSIPVFSLEAPPNLRTSLADRPASYVRGSSPASRDSSRSGRQSMSPTVSRSVGSSHSRDKDSFGVHSKASVASSGDDDTDSQRSFPIGSSAPRSIGTLPNMRNVGFSGKASKILSSSAPKRSFDLALRQMDKKGPQNMFRPLLSSVPSSTFASIHHRSLASRNSSITTSSNASSDQGTSGALDTREIVLNQEDLNRERGKEQYINLQDEIFSMDQADALIEDSGSNFRKESTLSKHGDIDGPSAENSQLGFADRNSQLDKAAAMDDYSNSYGLPDMAICSKCGLKFTPDDVIIEGYLQLCAKCTNLEINTRHNLLEILNQSTPEPLDATSSGDVVIDYLDEVTSEGEDSYSEPCQNPAAPLVEERIPASATNQDIIHQELQQDRANSNSRVEVSDGAGISLLLKKSSSSRGPIVQSRSFTASTTCYDDFSYMRNSMNSIRSSIGHSSASVSSSVDLGYAKKVETGVQRQSGCQKTDSENWMLDMPTKHKRSTSSFSGSSSHCFQVQSWAPSCHEDSIGAVKCVDPSERSLASEYMDSNSNIFKSAAELTDHLMNINSENISALPVSTSDSNNSIDADTLSAHSQPFGHEEDAMQSSCPMVVDVEEARNPSSLDAKSEMEMENADSRSYVDSINSLTDELLEPSDSVVQNDVTTFEESDISDLAHGAPEESKTVEVSVGRKSPSLTLEEATDAILFCNSIVHNLAYEAANIAIDKETPRVEPVLQPAVAFVAKSNSDRREVRSRNTSRRNSRSQKTEQKRLETNTKPASVDTEAEEKFSPHVVKSPYKCDSLKPPKLESRCNCTIM